MLTKLDMNCALYNIILKANHMKYIPVYMEIVKQ